MAEPGLLDMGQQQGIYYDPETGGHGPPGTMFSGLPPISGFAGQTPEEVYAAMPWLQPGNQGITQQDLQGPLAYTSDQQPYEPRDTGGFFSLDQLYDFAPGGAQTQGGTEPPGHNVPQVLQHGAGAPSTNNWRLLGRGPGWIMRSGQYINAASPEARQGLPYGYDTSFSDTAESGTANYPRRVNPGAALTGVNKYDATYWPGQEGLMGRTRWPYGTDV